LKENGVLYMLLSNIKRPRFPERDEVKKINVVSAAIGALSFAEQNFNHSTCLQRGRPKIVRFSQFEGKWGALNVAQQHQTPLVSGT
jgi:hypothetical protein